MPEITLENTKGLSDSQMEELQDGLKKLAKEKIGYEVLYELAEFVRVYLHQHNLPPRSCHDLMLKQQEDERKKKDTDVLQVHRLKIVLQMLYLSLITQRPD